MSNTDVEGGVRKGRASKSSYPAGYYSSPSHGESSSDKKWTSWLIPLFVVVNILLFILTMFFNNCPGKRSNRDGDCVLGFLRRFSFQPLKDNPLLGPSYDTLSEMQGLELYALVQDQQIWRLFTCIWLHGGVGHLITNMLFLVFIGVRLEQQFGFLKVGAIYLLSGLGGAILSSLFLQNNGVIVGASGALCGLLGSMTSELITNWTIYSNKVAALLTLIIIVTIELGIGLLPIIDNFSHIGGFFTGFLLGFVLLLRPQFGWVNVRNQPVDGRVKSKHMNHQYFLCVVALILLIAGKSVGLVMVFRGVNVNDHCSWCHYMDCVPTSKWKCN